MWRSHLSFGYILHLALNAVEKSVEKNCVSILILLWVVICCLSLMNVKQKLLDLTSKPQDIWMNCLILMRFLLNSMLKEAILLQLYKAYSPDIEAPFLNLNLLSFKGKVSRRIYNERYDWFWHCYFLISGCRYSLNYLIYQFIHFDCDFDNQNKLLCGCWMFIWYVPWHRWERYWEVFISEPTSWFLIISEKTYFSTMFYFSV